MIELALAALVALVVGLLIGWLVASRRTAAANAARDAEVEKGRAAETELAVLKERVDQLAPYRMLKEALAKELDDAKLELSALKAGGEEREAALRASQERLIADREMLTAQFSEIGGKILGDAQKAFLERADARFRQSEETAGQGLKALLQPVTERLQRYEEGVAKVEEARRDAFGDLKGQIEQMRIGQEKVSTEAAKLVNSLRNAPKSRGRWGEQQLKNVLETCGLHEHTDYQTEVSVGAGDDGGRLRPDAIISVPGGRALVVDAKVSLNAYQDAFGAVDDAERSLGLAAHAASMRAHVNGLGNKAYWSQFADAPDYVIMFVPGEHFLSAALEHDPTLWDFAFDKRVLLATPTNLIAIARTVAAVWRQEKLAKEARKIAELGKLMHERLQVAAGHLKTVGSGLATATNNYNRFVSSFETRVMVTGREFERLNIETGGRALEEVGLVDALPRYGDEEKSGTG